MKLPVDQPPAVALTAFTDVWSRATETGIEPWIPKWRTCDSIADVVGILSALQLKVCTLLCAFSAATFY